jgi:hypothetical protein
MTRIVLLKPYGANPKGAVLKPPQKDVAMQLVRRGVAKLEEEKPKQKKPKLQEWVKQGHE